MEQQGRCGGDGTIQGLPPLPLYSGSWKRLWYAHNQRRVLNDELLLSGDDSGALKAVHDRYLFEGCSCGLHRRTDEHFTLSSDFGSSIVGEVAH